MSDTEKTVAKKVPAKKVPAKKSTKETTRTRPTMPVRTRTFTFEQWAKRRGIKQHHKRGLRAYVLHVARPRSLEQWDKCFKDY